MKIDVKPVRLIIFAALLLAISFLSGVYYNSSIRASEVENRATELESLIESQAGTIRTITRQLESASRGAGELAEESGRFAEENRRFAESIGDMGIGLRKDQERVDWLIDGIQYYLDKVEAQD